ncbi:cytidine deaminase [Bdellovibrionota bacterium FG-1]
MTTVPSDLYQAACAARQNAYSPYSHHKVGAAIRTIDGKLFSGCNVENSSYGGTVCAERTAIFKAVSEVGPGMRIAEVVVVTDATPPWTPCGFCRQVLVEFASAETLVHSTNLSGQANTLRLGELLPEAFTSAHLQK